MKKERLYLLHILESIQYIEQYTCDGKATFEKSTLIQHAVIRNFEVMGEAVRRISEQTQQQYPHIPWQRIRGFRNFLIHDYDAIDLNRVWEIIEHEIPKLKPQIEAMVQHLDDSSK